MDNNIDEPLFRLFNKTKVSEPNSELISRIKKSTTEKPVFNLIKIINLNKPLTYFTFLFISINVTLILNTNPNEYNYKHSLYTEIINKITYKIKFDEITNMLNSSLPSLTYTLIFVLSLYSLLLLFVKEKKIFE